MQHVGSEYRKQNGLSRLSEPALQDYIHKAMDLVMKNQGATSEEIDESATEEIEMMNVARIGLVYFDYVERRPKMPLAIAAMCLSTFGVSTAPAVDWSTFESIVATHCHLTALAQGQLIETIALASQFPAKVSTDKDITNMNRIQFAERIEETWSRLGDKAKKHRKCYSLVVLNGPRAPFADVFVLRSTGVVEVIQCKRYKGSTVRKFGDSAFHEEVLKLGLRCNKPDEPNAEELAPTLHQLATVSSTWKSATWEGIDPNAPSFMTAIRSTTALNHLIELVAAATTSSKPPEVQAYLQFAEDPCKWDELRDKSCDFHLTINKHDATLSWLGNRSNVG